MSSAAAIASRFGSGVMYASGPSVAGSYFDVLALLHVEREIDQHRSRPALARDAERLAEGPRQLRRLLDLVRPLADGTGDVDDDVDRLERLLVQHVCGSPAR